MIHYNKEVFCVREGFDDSSLNSAIKACMQSSPDPVHHQEGKPDLTIVVLCLNEDWSFFITCLLVHV